MPTVFVMWQRMTVRTHPGYDASERYKREQIDNWWAVCEAELDKTRAQARLAGD